MIFNNDSSGNKLIFVRKTTTFSRLQLQKVTLRCKVDRSQLSQNLLVPSSPINFRPETGDSRFPGNSSTCLSKAVQHYATFRKTEILKLLGKPQISPRHLYLLQKVTYNMGQKKLISLLHISSCIDAGVTLPGDVCQI